jgi:hypothetical protein
VPATGADLQHFTARLGRREGKEKAARGRLDRNGGRANLLDLEAREDLADALVQH